jgi:hypothetical protein
MSGPSAGPSSIGTPTTLITRPTCLGPAAWANVIIPIGMIMPPASPCRARKAISDSALHATPHSALVATNADTAVIQTRRGPKRSAAQPVSGMTVARASRYAVATHWIVESGAWRSRPSVCSATLTIVVSRIDIIAPTMTTTATRRVSGLRPSSGVMYAPRRAAPGTAPPRATGSRSTPGTRPPTPRRSW